MTTVFAPVGPDPWLNRWLPLLRAHAGDAPVLELGCGEGRDTGWLDAQGFAVIGCDVDARALAQCAQRVPAARLVRLNLRAPLPFAPASFNVVLASLSLHYFPWVDTLALAARIRALLRPGGVLLCRLNSTRDIHHGAVGNKAIEPDFYSVDGRYSSTKRFFDEAAVRAMFAGGWEMVALEEMEILRYAQSKVVWEAVLRAS